MRLLAPLLLTLAACGPVAGPGAVGLSTDFEAGSLGRVEQLTETHFRGAVLGQADQDGRNRQPSWYYFRIDHARGREITVTLTDLVGEYDDQPGALCVRPDIPPVVSSDGRSWRHQDAIVVGKTEATIRVTPDSDEFWVAHIEPYTTSRLERLLDEIRGTPGLEDEVIGKSVQGRDLHLLTFRPPLPPADHPPEIWLMCRQHAWETGTSFVGEGAIRYLLSRQCEALRKVFVFRIFPTLDPDGCAQGGIRFNRNGYDLNRNWDIADPDHPAGERLMPEICAVKKLPRPGRGLFMTLHNQESDEWLSSTAQNRKVAERLFERLLEKTTFSPSGAGPRAPGPPPAPGRATVYDCFDSPRMPAFLLEQGIAKSARLGRPATSQDRLEFGAQLIQDLAEIASEER